MGLLFLKEMQTEGGATSFGEPEPFGIRVFSSMAAPQTCAVMIGAGLILLFSIRARSSQQLLANGLGYLSLLLTLARSGWLSWLFGILVFSRTLKFNLQIRMLIGILMTILIILPVTTVEPFSTVIGERIESLGDTDSDGSFTARQETFKGLLGQAVIQVTYGGLQNPITPDVKVKMKSSYVIGDNGLLVLFFTVGWIGGLPYLLGITFAVLEIRQACLKNKDLVLQASYGIILGLLFQILFKSLTDGALACLLWGFMGIGMSARKYHLSQRISAKSP